MWVFVRTYISVGPSLQELKHTTLGCNVMRLMCLPDWAALHMAWPTNWGTDHRWGDQHGPSVHLCHKTIGRDGGREGHASAPTQIYTWRIRLCVCNRRIEQGRAAFIVSSSLSFVWILFILHGIYLLGPDYMFRHCNGSCYKKHSKHSTSKTTK